MENIIFTENVRISVSIAEGIRISKSKAIEMAAGCVWQGGKVYSVDKNKKAIFARVFGINNATEHGKLSIVDINFQ